MHPTFSPPALARVNRRQMLRAGGAGVAAHLLAVGPAHAQASYPSQAIKVVVPFGPGGLADISTRLIGQKVGESWASKCSPITGPAPAV